MSKHVTVVLLHDVPHLGSKGAVRTVSFGYAKNALLPKGLAIMATPQALEQAKQDAAAQEHQQAKETHEQDLLKHALSTVTVSIRVKANEKGSLFGSVSAPMLAEALSAQGVHGVEKGMITIPEKIDAVGNTRFIVMLGDEPITVPLRVAAESS